MKKLITTILVILMATNVGYCDSVKDDYAEARRIEDQLQIIIKNALANPNDKDLDGDIQYINVRLRALTKRLEKYNLPGSKNELSLRLYAAEVFAAISLMGASSDAVAYYLENKSFSNLELAIAYNYQAGNILLDLQDESEYRKK